MATAGKDYLRNCFRGFAGICANASPLYAALSPQIADDPQTLALAEQTQAGQAPVNMLFGAVHYLLLGGMEHALAGFYRSLGGRDDPAGAWPVSKDFCGTFRGEIVELVATRRVQTNEVGRPAAPTAPEPIGADREAPLGADLGHPAGLRAGPASLDRRVDRPQGASAGLKRP